jgi:CMP/dCMP kinase
LKDKDLSVSLRALISSIRERDERDRSRAVSPLKPAHDAVLIDSSGLAVESVCALAWRHVTERGLVPQRR